MESLSATKKDSWLIWFLRGILALGFLVLFARLADLQVIRGKYYHLLAEENRVRRIPILAPRGKILARGGQVLIGNKEIKKRVVFDPIDGYHKTDDLTDASPEELVTEYIRDYRLKSAFAHAGGYLGLPMPEEAGKVDAECPEKGPRSLEAYVGRTGLEESYDCVLRGIDGEELVEVDSKGNRIRSLGKRDPVPGTDVKTSVDYYLQEEVGKKLTNARGAIVVTDTKGSVLALYSSPSFNPEIFIDPAGSEAVGKLFTDPNLPLFNRALGGAYHPGSVFKPTVALAALSEDKVTGDFLYEDTGAIVVNEYSYSNWFFTQYGRTEGAINIEKALARSTDTFFYKIGEFLGIEKMESWARRFGYGRHTEIDVPGEVSGLVPNPTWKKIIKGENWFLGNTYHVSIGQGDLTATPLQVNRSIAGIASKGEVCTVGLAKPPSCSKLNAEEADFTVVANGMKQACEEGGTGYTFFNFEPRVACKTGTAETGKEEIYHAWFSLFAPAESPEVVATVLVEEGGEGSKAAGPVAREVMDYWFGKEPANR